MSVVCRVPDVSSLIDESAISTASFAFSTKNTVRALHMTCQVSGNWFTNLLVY